MIYTTIVDDIKQFARDEAFTEAIRELFRVGVLAILPVSIGMLEKNTFDWKLVGITFAIAVLRAIDKWLHEYGKITDQDEISKGLTRF